MYGSLVVACPALILVFHGGVHGGIHHLARRSLGMILFFPLL